MLDNYQMPVEFFLSPFIINPRLNVIPLSP